VQEQGEVVYDLTAHYHNITVDSSGNVQLGTPQKNKPAPFNIADTKVYKDAVSAATVASRAILYCNATNYTDFDTGFDCDMSGASYHYEVNGVSYGRLEVRNSTGTGLKTIRVKLPASSSSGSATVQTVTSIAATSSNYNTYDKAIAPSFASLYTSGNYSYGLASINLSNGVNSTLRFRVPAVNSITVARPYGDNRDWDLSEDNHVYVKVNLSALSGSTVLATDTGRVNVDDIVTFWADQAYDHASALDTNQSNYGTYDLSLNLGLSGKSYVSGTQRYGRIGIYNGEGGLLSTIRVYMPITAVSRLQSYSTLSDISGGNNDYHQVGNEWYLYVRAKDSSNNTIYTGEINVQFAVDWGAQQGGNYSYYWSDEKTGPYGSKQRDCYFTVNGSIVQTAKVIWSSGNPSFQ